MRTFSENCEIEIISQMAQMFTDKRHPFRKNKKPDSKILESGFNFF
jgi:hypothetical protein